MPRTLDAAVVGRFEGESLLALFANCGVCWIADSTAGWAGPYTNTCAVQGVSSEAISTDCRTRAGLAALCAFVA